MHPRNRLFKKTQDSNFEIKKRIFVFFPKQNIIVQNHLDHGASLEPTNTNPEWIIRSPLTHRNLSGLKLICLMDKREIGFWILISSLSFSE